MSPITYTSDQLAEYMTALDAADTLPKLAVTLERFRPVAADAFDVMPKDENEFKAWRKGLAQERRGKFAGQAFAERFNVLLMPEVLFQVGLVASHFHAPFGCAFIQLQRAGRVSKQETGIFHWESA